MQREGECPLPPGSRRRDMPIGLQGGKGGIFFLASSLLHFVLLAKLLPDGQSGGRRAALQVLPRGHRGGGQSQRENG